MLFFLETKTVASILNLLMSLSVRFVQNPFMLKCNLYLLTNKDYHTEHHSHKYCNTR